MLLYYFFAKAELTDHCAPGRRDAGVLNVMNVILASNGTLKTFQLNCSWKDLLGEMPLLLLKGSANIQFITWRLVINVMVERGVIDIQRPLYH